MQFLVRMGGAGGGRSVIRKFWPATEDDTVAPLANGADTDAYDHGDPQNNVLTSRPVYRSALFRRPLQCPCANVPRPAKAVAQNDTLRPLKKVS
jgi:hypothetical protein